MDTFILWLVLVPVIIFSIKPIAPSWVRSARIIFLFAASVALRELTILLGPHVHEPLAAYSTEWQFYKYTFLSAGWRLLLDNIYIGWWELLWRGYHKQWSKRIKDNLQYGVLSTGCIALSLAMTMGFLLFTFYVWLQVVFFYR